MSIKQSDIEKYTKDLFNLTDRGANVSEFIDLYIQVFGVEPEYDLVNEYQNKVNPEANSNEEDDSYSYEESYSYDDDSYNYDEDEDDDLPQVDDKEV